MKPEYLDKVVNNYFTAVTYAVESQSANDELTVNRGCHGLYSTRVEFDTG